MFDDDHRRTTIAKHRTDNTVEDTPDLCPRLSLDVDTLLIEGDMSFHIRHRISTKTVHNLITANDRHRQTTTVTLETATESLVFSRHHITSLCRFAGLCHLPLPCLGLLCSPTFSIFSGTFCLLGCTFGSGLLLSTFLGSSTSLSLGFLFLGLGLSDATGILLGSSLSSSFLPGKFLSTFLGCLSLSLLLSFSFSLRLGTGNLLCNEFVDTGVKFRITFLLLVDDTLNSLLLFLQRTDHLLLLHLFRLQRPLLLFTTIEQVILQLLRTLQFIEGFLHLSLHRLHGLTLCLLISGIITDKTQATVHL